MPLLVGSDITGHITRVWLCSDGIGLTVGFVVVPQSMAYAFLAQLSPEYGLFTSFAGFAVYWIFGTSRDVVVGVSPPPPPSQHRSNTPPDNRRSLPDHRRRHSPRPSRSARRIHPRRHRPRPLPRHGSRLRLHRPPPPRLDR